MEQKVAHLEKKVVDLAQKEVDEFDHLCVDSLEQKVIGLDKKVIDLDDLEKSSAAMIRSVETQVGELRQFVHDLMVKVLELQSSSRQSG